MKTFIKILDEMTTTVNIPNIPTMSYELEKCVMKNGTQGWSANNGRCYVTKAEAIAHEK